MPHQRSNHESREARARISSYESIIERIIRDYGGRETLSELANAYEREKKRKYRLAFIEYKKVLRAEKAIYEEERNISYQSSSLNESYNHHHENSKATWNSTGATLNKTGATWNSRGIHRQVEQLNHPSWARFNETRTFNETSNYHHENRGATWNNRGTTRTNRVATWNINYESSDEEATVNPDEEGNGYPSFCCNCFRENNDSLNDFYRINFETIWSDEVRSRKFKNFTTSRNENLQHIICKECKIYLTTDNEHEKDKCSWPSFLWKLLLNEEIISIYGYHVWKLIPRQWRFWFIESLKEYEPQNYERITIDFPPPLIQDVSEQRHEWDRLLNSYTLPNLRDACNKFMVPTVLCPFGCSEFLNRCGTVSMDMIFQRYIQHAVIDLYSKREAYASVMSCREDFIEFKNKKESMWLFNEDWKVLPSICFIQGVPRVLTCRDHNGGSKLFHIHGCRQPNHSLASLKPDQLCHGVLKTRTIKPMQKRIYSNAYQMHEQRGSFNGIDTCNLTNMHDFSYRSKIQSESESRSIINRSDINALLTELVSEKKIANITASDKRKLAQRMYDKFNFEPYLYGSTYVPLHIAMAIQKEQNNPYCTVIIDDRKDSTGNYLPAITVKSKIFWPPSLYPCQKMTKWGALTPLVPKFRSQNSQARVIWMVSSMMIGIEEVWKLVVDSELKKSNWRGWLLVYITKLCFTQSSRRQGRGDIFSFTQVSTVDKMLSKFPNDEPLFHILETFQEIKCINLNEHDVDGITFQELAEETDIGTKVIVTYPNSDYQNDMAIHGKRYELRYILDTWEIRGHKWDSEVFMRHGGHFSHWYFQQRYSKMATKVVTRIPALDTERDYLFVYVCTETIDYNKAREAFLQHIGGQTHVRCDVHTVPLIQAVNKKLKCQCGKSAYLKCSVLGCSSNICRSCFRKCNTREETHVRPFDGTEVDESSDIDSDSEIDESSSDSEFEFHQEDDDESIVHVQGSDVILEVDDFDNFVTCSVDPDLPPDIEGEDFGQNEMPFSDAGEVPFEVEEDYEKKGVFGDITINGYTLLNQCGSLLTRKNYELNGSSKQQFFLQKVCSTSIGKSIPLLYPEGLIFPSIFYSTAGDECSVLGAIPACLLTEGISKFGFSDIPTHVRSKITSSLSSTNSNSHFIAYCYDMVVNLASNREDTRCVINNGLMVVENKIGGLGLKSKGDPSLLQFIDNKAMVRNLCSSQLHHKMDVFLTYTCNMKKHFGTQVVKSWVDDGLWKKNFPDYEQLDRFEEEEIEESIVQASSNLLLRIWQETSALFLNYLRKSPTSPYKSVLSIFARYEYQKQLNWKQLTNEHKDFILELVRASILEIVKSNEVEDLIKDGTFQCCEDYNEMLNDAIKFLPHECTSACQAKVVLGGEKKYQCRKLDNLKISKDNTKHTYQALPNDISEDCKERLVQIGLAEESEVAHNGYKRPFKCSLALFHPNRHIPRTNPTGDLNISPVEGYTFANCRSMQNIQILTQAGGVNKYVCKYIVKMDEQNYVIVRTDSHKNGKLVKRSAYVHKGEDANSNKSERDSHVPQGRIISHMEILHQLLQYPGVITNLNFVNIQTVPIELRVGLWIERRNDAAAQDGVNVGSTSDGIRRTLNLEGWRQHREEELMMISDYKQSKVSIDKISLFSLRPPELKVLIKKPGQYFRWFSVTKKVVSGSKMINMLDADLKKTAWIDGLQHQVLVRRKALCEIMKYCDTIESIDIRSPTSKMVRLFSDLNLEIGSEHALNEEFRFHILDNLLDEDVNCEHLPCPVYSYVKPTTGPSFLHHILVSMGQYETEIDLIMHNSIRESFRYAKLIGDGESENELRSYSDGLLREWIKCQLQFFPNSLRLLALWIVVAGNLFDSIILRNEIPMTDMPPVQLSTILGNNDDMMQSYLKEVQIILAKAILREIGQDMIDKCNVPCEEEFETCTKTNQLAWNALDQFKKNSGQSEANFVEQRFAIKICSETVDKYINLWDLKTLTKNIGIRGFPGSGKTWCSLYCALYAMSKGLHVLTTALLAKRAINLGGIHYHKLFCLPIGRNLNVQRKAELAILKLLRNPKQLNLLLSLDVLICDELGQTSAEFWATIDIILRRIRNTNIYLGGVLIIGTIDHTQIQPIEGRPFLTATHMLSCWRMIALRNSIRASTDLNFQRIQEIARKSHRELKENMHLVDEMIALSSQHLTFVTDWNDPKIDPQAMRLYSKKIPAKEAARDFENRVRVHVNPYELRKRIAEDVEKPRYSQMQWSKARDSIVGHLEQKVKEPKQILFFKGAIYECTFNDPNGQFTQSQMALLYELPSRATLDQWGKIKILVAPPGLKEIVYNSRATKEYYIGVGFSEVNVGIAPERTHSVTFDMFGRRKQYGLRHHVVMTVHSAMGDTLNKMITRISIHEKNFTMWDKGQLIVVLSRTKVAKDSVFVGPKKETLDAFRQLMLLKTCWSDHMERVLEVITVNQNDQDSDVSRILNTETYPHLIRDIVLPQCNTGYVYMLVSLRIKDFIYIGTTNCIRSRLKAHNCGHGSTSTEPTYLRPYALFAYICGFGGGRKDLRYHIEKTWKEKRDELIRNGNTNHRSIALSANSIIRGLNENQFGVAPSELILVCLFE